MPSALWPVRSALHTLFTAAFDGTDTAVFDGPRIRGARAQQYVLVGANGELNDTPYARTVQQPSAMAGGWRDEAGEVDCTAVVWSGDTDLAALRTLAETIVDACEAAINADPTLGGVLQPANHRAELTGLDVREAHTDKGPFVEAVFTVSYTTVLTS